MQPYQMSPEGMADACEQVGITQMQLEQMLAEKGLQLVLVPYPPIPFPNVCLSWRTDPRQIEDVCVECGCKVFHAPYTPKHALNICEDCEHLTKE